MRVRRLTFLIVLIIACSSVSRTQRSAQDRPLELSSSIISQRYCVGDAGVDFLHLKLGLKFTNVGNQKLILYKGNNLFFSVWIKPNQNEARGARFEMKATASRFFKTTPEDVDKGSPNRDFVFLSPHESFETFIDVSLPVAREEARRSRGSINAGEHLLQITASTWYESRKLGESLRERWQRKGVLWLDPVGSTPVSFNSDKPDSAQSCQGNNNVGARDKSSARMVLSKQRWL